MLTLYIADVERDAGMKNLSRKEAAKVLEDMKVKIEIPKAAVTQWKRNTALDMAIEALVAQDVTDMNDGDMIYRQEAIDALSHMMDTDGFRNGWAVSRANVDCMLRSLPSAQSNLQPTCNQLATDCISRQASIDAIDVLKRNYPSSCFEDLCKAVDIAIKALSAQAEIDTWRADFKGYVDCLDLPMDDYNGIMEYIDEAPSVQPERKTGRWTWNENGMDWGLGAWCCSECGIKAETWWANDKKYNPLKCSGGNFCGICGADMRGEQDG